jgi:hypothetical protein
MIPVATDSWWTRWLHCESGKSTGLVQIEPWADERQAREHAELLENEGHARVEILPPQDGELLDYPERQRECPRCTKTEHRTVQVSSAGRERACDHCGYRWLEL